MKTKEHPDVPFCRLDLVLFVQALLLNEDNQGFCGGTILNNYIILTAAHCMNQSRYIYVKLGPSETSHFLSISEGQRDRFSRSV